MVILDQIADVVAEFGLSSFSISYVNGRWFSSFFDDQGLTRYQATGFTWNEAAQGAIDRLKADRGIKTLEETRRKR